MDDSVWTVIEFTILYSKYINLLLYSKYQVTQKMCGATYYDIMEMSDIVYIYQY